MGGGSHMSPRNTTDDGTGQFNRDAHFSSGNDEWATPIDLVRGLKRSVGGSFDLDAAAGCEPSPIADHRYTEAEDGTAQPWFGYTYCNPPYSDMETWAEKAATEASREDGPDLIVFLIPGRTSTDWFHDHVAEADYFGLFDGRLEFIGADNSAPFPSILAIFDGTDGDPGVPDDLLAFLESEGAVFSREDVDAQSEQATLAQLTDISAERTVPDFAPDPSPVSTATVGDRLQVSLIDDSIGFPTGIRPEAEVKVVGGDAAGETKEVLAVADYGPAGSGATETYYCLSYPEGEPQNVRCAVCEHGSSDWVDVALEGVSEVATTPGGPAPGEATA
jgi:phage N-6-adenine-methyltransferase